MFIICPYLWAWQSILHSASADRWKNDPCLTLPSITSLLPSLLSSWSPSETRLTACYISSSHSNPPHPHILMTELFLYHACSIPHLQHVFESLSCNNWGWDKREGAFSKTIEDNKESEYLLSLQPLHLQPSSSNLSCCQWVHLSADTVRRVYFTMFFLSTLTLYSSYHMVTPCWHRTQNTMYIQNCWWLLCDPHAWRQTALKFPLPFHHLACFVCFWLRAL